MEFQPSQPANVVVTSRDERVLVWTTTHRKHSKPSPALWELHTPIAQGDNKKKLQRPCPGPACPTRVRVTVRVDAPVVPVAHQQFHQVAPTETRHTYNSIMIPIP